MNKTGEAYTENHIGHKGCVSLKCWYRSDKQLVLTDEVCNAIEVHTKQSYWLDCGESAELLSRGMYEEMHQELERSKGVP